MLIILFDRSRFIIINKILENTNKIICLNIPKLNLISKTQVSNLTGLSLFIYVCVANCCRQLLAKEILDWK